VSGETRSICHDAARSSASRATRASRSSREQDPGDPAAATVLRQAVALARGQGAWLHALRAATDLVRLERRGGGPAAGEASLREIYTRFTDGFDLPDLRAARELLEPPSITR
jgi:hypothetical protein